MKLEQLELDIGTPSYPIHDITNVILDRGYLSKNDVLELWSLDEDQYSDLRRRYEAHRLVEPGQGKQGGFVARYGKRPARGVEAETSAPAFKTEYERIAADRLVELLNYQELEGLLGRLVYVIRRARQLKTKVDRRGTKQELAAAVLTKYGVDLFADRDARELIAKRAKVVFPKRWHAGKERALEFTRAVQFPVEFAGLPADEPAEDFEFLEGRVDLKALQDFQEEVQRKLQRVLHKPSSRAIVTLPTGGGKTRVAVDTIRDWLTERYKVEQTGAGNVVLWLAHTEELCEQATLCFREVWQGSSDVAPLALFRFWGGYTRDLASHGDALLTMERRPAVLVSTPQRLLNLLDDQLPNGGPIKAALLSTLGLLLIDEAHRAAAPTYSKLIRKLANAERAPCIVGLTATPFRQEYDANDPAAGTRELRDLFRLIIEPEQCLGEDPRTSLQERGYLAKPLFWEIKTDTRLKAPEGLNIENPNEDEIEKIDYALKIRADRPERRLACLDRMVELCEDKESLVIYFGPTLEDAECMAFLLRQAGIEAAFVCGKTREVTRRKVISDFKSGRIQVLCNCEVLTTGFDAPKVTHVVLARPTVSQVLYEQMVGRGLRGPKFGGTETCHIIDVADDLRGVRPPLGYRRFREVWARKRPRRVS